jgi:hypothetical protein
LRNKKKKIETEDGSGIFLQNSGDVQPDYRHNLQEDYDFETQWNFMSQVHLAIEHGVRICNEWS